MSGIDIALIGAGRMGMALAEGWQAGKPSPSMALIDPMVSNQARALAENDNVHINAEPEPARAVVVAVKPQIFGEAAPSMRAWIGPKTLVVSIMAGIRLKTLADALGTEKIVRAMPNTPGSIGRGVSVISPHSGAQAEDVAEAQSLLTPLGMVEGPVEEELLSAVTALSGSGPAYVFLLAEAMAAAGVAGGLPEGLADRLARATVAGAGALMEASDEAPSALRQAVTSKGGTTQAALDILMQEDGVPSIIRTAMRAAAERERQLSEG